MKRAWLAALVIFGASCDGSGLTEIVLVVDSTFPAGAMDMVTITVDRHFEGPQVYTIDPGMQQFPLTLGLSPFDAAAMVSVEITVVGLLSFTEVTRRQVRTQFLRNRSLLLRVVLTPSCQMAMCEPSETCDEGGCTSVVIDPSALADFTGDLAPMCPRRQDERCNMVDDDCDGMLDEGIDVMIDARNCGMCGRRCTHSCAGGECIGGELGLLTAGGSHACAWAQGGGAYCWGSDFTGQLGIGPITPREGMLSTYVRTSATPVESLSMIDAISAGGGHTCALNAMMPFCWGNNSDGQVGDGSQVDAFSPVMVSGLATADQIAAGGGHSCAISAGQLYCWGRNDHGQLGIGTTVSSLLPAMVTLPAMASHVATGVDHTCAVAGTSLYCWGANADGQLGIGGTTDASTPMVVSGLDSPKEFAAGDRHTCAVASDGRVMCWGANDSHQLGDGTVDAHDTPQPVLVVTGAQHVTVSAGAHACAWGTDGAWCWGLNTWGEVGADGTTPTTPVALPITSPQSVVAGGDSPPLGGFTCALQSSHQISCWGRNHLGELGIDDGFAGNATPQMVQGLP